MPDIRCVPGFTQIEDGLDLKLYMDNKVAKAWFDTDLSLVEPNKSGEKTQASKAKAMNKRLNKTKPVRKIAPKMPDKKNK